MAKRITAKEFDRIFDEGKEDITQYIVQGSARRLGKNKKTVEVELSTGLVDKVDKEAKDAGVSRHEIITRVLNDYFQKVAV
jgi:hypothetical protein